MCARVGDVVVTDLWPLQDKVADDVEVILTANVGFTDHPVATWRPSAGIGVLTVNGGARLAPEEYSGGHYD